MSFQNNQLQLFVSYFCSNDHSLFLFNTKSSFKYQFVYFLNQACAGHNAWFFKIDPVQIVYMRVCVCVCLCACVSAPEAINNQWCDMDLVRLVKQVLQLFSIWQLQSLSLMGVALALVHVVDTNPLRVSQRCIRR